MAKRRLMNRFVNDFSPVPILTGEDKLPGRVGRLFELVEGRDQPDVIFAGMFESRDVKKKRVLDFQRLPDTGFSFLIGERSKTGMIEAVVDDPNAIARDIEEPENIPRGIATDGDDRMLP